MKTLIKSTIATLLLSFTTLHAGSGHSHGEHAHGTHKKVLNKESIKQHANEKLALLVKKEKLPKSWSKTPVLDMKQKQFNHKKEWVVRFKNTDIKDEEKQILYIFVSLYGDITGANHTGN